ncbi:putative LPS assembly protein LptD [Neolewinella lacunae]|uniref:LPS-assembly protein LptD n=1 Tax=Neolewinella lacunae TaxID=1517758 RepID=A0A923PPS5_9BACT|nr:putative LPS assembly protein LptD [Neolewinella lacunae]MBC6995178.1 LPS-assembly protein LptD [Neolewinella lacunae]MDN3634128.1 putative LPS assembly protein LptD [Neolewinella lacunae]
MQLLDSARIDTIVPTKAFAGSTADFVMSADSLTAPVTYAAEDSMTVDFVLQEIHLYGAAEVTYQTINLKANHIILNYGTNLVYAEPLPDSLGRPAGAPEFSDGGQSFTAREMRYNFKTRKGIVYGTTTTQDDIFVRGGKSKFVSGAVQVNDTVRADVIYTQGAIFTTCSAEHPHFGIRTQRAKVIPNRLAVIGPSNLEIMGVPTPLWLPFGFFPLKSGRSTGLLFPSDYQYSPQWGYGLQGVGWFFPIGEHVNLQATADYFLRGTYSLNTNLRYVRRYKYTGSFNASFKNLRREDRELNEFFDKGISIQWSHRQDRAAHPTFNFGGSLNFQTNIVDQRFINSFEVASQNTIRSSMNLTKNFPKLKSTLTAGLNHSQNNQSRIITVNFPDATFQTQTIYPLRELPGKQSAWWKKLSFRYKNALRTEFEAPDSTFFTQATLDAGEYGFRHDINSALSLNVLKYFNVSPSINYGEVYYGKTRAYNLDGNVQRDTLIDPITGEEVITITSLGEIISSLNPGVASFRTFSAAVNVSTQLFGKVRFRKKGLLGLQGLRHVMKPNVSIGYNPNYIDAEDYISGEPYFLREDEIDPLNGDPTRLLSPFANQIFGAPSPGKRNLGLSYSITNLFEAKIWNAKDSTSQNIKLFENIGISGSYDFTLDSLKWSPVNLTGGTQFFKGLTRVNIGATFDPYATQYDPVRNQFRRVEISNLSEGRFPLSLTRFESSITTNLTVSKIRQLFQGAEEEVVTDIEEERRKRREEETTLFEETDLLSLFERFSIQHTFRFRFQREFDTEAPDVDDRGRPRFSQLANSIELRGALQLTNNWSVNIGQIGYDFTSRRITYPFLSFVRDLHCWEMRFSWAPQRNFYSFSIAVKPGTLDFINLPVNQNRYDGGQLFDNR